MSVDADRLRRTFDDFWLFRILYPAGLLVPWFAPELPYRAALAAYGAVLLVAWLCGIAYVVRKGLLRVRPEDPSCSAIWFTFPNCVSSAAASKGPGLAAASAAPHPDL